MPFERRFVSQLLIVNVIKVTVIYQSTITGKLDVLNA